MLLTREGTFWGYFVKEYSVINEIPLHRSVSLTYYLLNIPSDDRVYF